MNLNDKIAESCLPKGNSLDAKIARSAFYTIQRRKAALRVKLELSRRKSHVS
jgi:hypothetical protein